MNNFMGDREPNSPGEYLAFHKFLEISVPSERFVFLDEHEDSIGDGLFFSPVQSEWPNMAWEDIPSSRHGGGCDLSFADGHVEHKKWLDPRTRKPVTRTRSDFVYSQPNNVDALWVHDRTTNK